MLAPLTCDNARSSAGVRSRPGRRVVDHIRRFLREEQGSVTVEAVLWLPILFGFVMLVTDVSMAFYGKAQGFRIVQDANRALSVHRISTAWEVKRFVEGSMRTWAPNATARVCLSNDGIVSTILTVPIGDTTSFMKLGSFDFLKMTIASREFIEWTGYKTECV